MKKYNELVSGQFGHQEHKIDIDDLFGQRIDEAELERQSDESDIADIDEVAVPTYQRRKTYESRGHIAAQPNKIKYPALSEKGIKQGDSLQIINGIWHNAEFIPENSIFTVTGIPVKVRKANDSIGPAEYLIKGNLLLPTGQTAQIRVSISNCTQPEVNDLQKLDDELSW